MGHGDARGQCGGRARLRGIGMGVQSWEPGSRERCSCTPAQAWVSSPRSPAPAWRLCAGGHRPAIPRRAESCAIAGGRSGTVWFQGDLSGRASLSIRWPQLAGSGLGQPWGSEGGAAVPVTCSEPFWLPGKPREHGAVSHIMGWWSGSRCLWEVEPVGSVTH